LKNIIPNSLKKKIKLFLHKGNKYECPFCGFQSKDFSTIGVDLPVNTKKRIIGAGLRNGGCFKCSSTDRERLIYVHLTKEFKISDKPNVNVLHLAPEKNLSNFLQTIPLEKYICGDLFTEGYAYPDYVENMNVLNIPFADEKFDLIICNHLLEHVEEDLLAMRELFRVLKKGGQAVLQVPISYHIDKTYEDFTLKTNEEREDAFGQFNHVRIYGADYVDRLESVGFTVNKINISKKYERYGLNPEEDIFIASK
jgi:SAM-dependent methyltransferase